MTIGDPQLLYSNQRYDTQLDQMKKIGRTADHSRSSAGKKNDKLYNACVEFESLFIKQMLDVMRKSVEKSDFLNGGMAEDIFEDMLYDRYALLMAKNSGFGIADTAYRQLTPQESGIISAQKQ